MRIDRPLIGTYRLQLHPGFTFDTAALLVPYLRELGISHLYLSPIFEAVPGSLHGYDGVDPTQIRGELGGRRGFDRLVDTAHTAGLGLVIDIVPNHLATHDTNPWWWALLAGGHASPLSATFDIDWDPPAHRLRERVLLAILGDHYALELEAGALRLAWEGERFVIRYHDVRLPVSAESHTALLAAPAIAAAPEQAANAISGDPDRLRCLPPTPHGPQPLRAQPR